MKISPDVRAYGIAVAVTVVVAGAGLLGIAPVVDLRNALFDGYQRILPRDRKSAPAVAVVIDEHSLGKFGQWPWPRDRTAELLDRIIACQPAAVALVMLLSEPDRTSGTNDEALAASVARGPVILGMAPGPRTNLQLAKYKGAEAKVPPDLRLPEFQDAIHALDSIHNAAVAHGNLAGTQSASNVQRRIPAFVRVGDFTIASMPLQALAVGSEARTMLVAGGKWGVHDLRIGTAVTSVQSDGQQWIRFGKFDLSRYISAYEVLEGKGVADTIKGRIVFIGLSAAGLLDYKLTPLGEFVPGAEIFMQVTEQIYDGTALSRPNYMGWIEAAILVAAGLALAVVARRRSALGAVTLFAGLLAAITAAGLLAFSHGLLFDIATPSIGWAVVFATALTTSLVTARRAREKAVYMFSRFVNPHVVKELLKDESFAGGGQQREVTLLFSDIRNFTSLSEHRDPKEIVDLLNKYYAVQVDVVFSHQGVLDKFIGDAMMVFWGAPLDDPHHARNAVSCALAMESALDGFRTSIGVSADDFDIGIGVHTGEVVVGLIGTDARREYTAIGSAVNIASRIEGLTKEARRRILVTRETVDRCGSAFAFDLVGRFPVKGIEKPVEVYEPRRPEERAAGGSRSERVPA